MRQKSELSRAEVWGQTARWAAVLLALLGIMFTSSGHLPALADRPENYSPPTEHPAPGAITYTGKLPWYMDLDTGLQHARSDNKLVLVDVYTGWCGWCKKLDRDTYPVPEVVDFLTSGYVCVKIDAEDGGPGEAFAKHYQVRGYPAILVLDSAGKMRGAFYGYRGPKDFPAAVSKATSGGPDND